jgi:ABC-2 type transport system permease protein
MEGAPPLETRPAAPFHEAPLSLLLAPKIRAARRRAVETATVARVLLLGTVALLFWTLLFAVVYRLLLYFRGAAGIGEALAAKLLGLVLLGFLSILLLSNIITALSSFFLARDLELVIAAPVDNTRVYAARLIETVTQSSWMPVLVLTPIFVAYARVYDGGLLFLAVAVLTLLCYITLPAVVGVAITLVLVNVFPARRARDLLALVALFGVAALILFIRVIRPEQLARPEGFRNLVDFVATLQTPRSSWLPSEWAVQALLSALNLGDRPGDLFPLLLLSSTAAAFLVIGAWLHDRLHRQGFSRAQEGSDLVEGKRKELRRNALTERLPVTVRALISKDIRAFFRDTTQWSQLILLLVLVVIYIYNVKALPLWTGENVGFFLINVVSFLNLGLAGFVLAAISARFLFPAISLEGRTLWLLRSSPLDLKSLLWTKYWVGLVPLLVLAVALTVGTNIILRVGPFMMTLSLVTIIVMSFAIGALALGLGALFPRLESDNAAEISTGFGGLLFMMAATTYLVAVIAVEAWPVYAFLRARLAGQPLESSQILWLAAGFGAAAALSAAVIIVPLRMAVRRIGEMEPL